MDLSAVAGLGGIGIGVGLVVIGGGYGIGRLAGSSVEAIARQPEAAGNIRGTAIILAALIEGFTFFALIVAILLGGNALDSVGDKGFIGPKPTQTIVTAVPAATTQVEKAPH